RLQMRALRTRLGATRARPCPLRRLWLSLLAQETSTIHQEERKMTDTRAAIYCRVSSEDQARPDKVSLATQREKCEAYLTVQGWQAGGVFEDAGVSGAKSSRPALDAMLEAARAGEVQRILVWKLDRLARNLRHLLNLSAELESLGVGLVSVSDGFDTGTS